MRPSIQSTSSKTRIRTSFPWTGSTLLEKRILSSGMQERYSTPTKPPPRMLKQSTSWLNSSQNRISNRRYRSISTRSMKSILDVRHGRKPLTRLSESTRNSPCQRWWMVLTSSVSLASWSGTMPTIHLPMALLSSGLTLHSYHSFMCEIIIPHCAYIG